MSPHSKSLMLFAAGRGTRMGALTKCCPKPLIKVSGRPLIDYALDIAKGVRADPIVANTHYLAEMLVDHLADENVLISHEAETLLDTGGGLRNALPLLGAQPVFTLNSDAIWVGENPLEILTRAWDPNRMDALLIVAKSSDVSGQPDAGDFLIDTDGRLIRGPGLIYLGAQILKTNALADVPTPIFSLNEVWDLMQAKGRLFGVVYPGQWCDVGSPAGITKAEEMLRTASDV